MRAEKEFEMKVSVFTVLGALEWIAQVGGEDLTKKIRRSENRREVNLWQLAQAKVRRPASDDWNPADIDSAAKAVVRGPEPLTGSR